jgi:hypothetical protein
VIRWTAFAPAQMGQTKGMTTCGFGGALDTPYAYTGPGLLMK